MFFYQITTYEKLTVNFIIWSQVFLGIPHFTGNAGLVIPEIVNNFCQFQSYSNFKIVQHEADY